MDNEFKKSVSSLEEQQKAKSFVESLDANSLTVMVQDMLQEYSVFLLKEIPVGW